MRGSPESSLHIVLSRAHRVLKQTQGKDGSWDGACNLGPLTTAQAAVVLHRMGRLSGDDAIQTARWLRAQQRADGSYVAYPSAGVGHLGTTASAWAAMHVLAPDESADAIARARAWVDRNGGLDAVVDGLDGGEFSGLFMGLAGLLDPHKLPCPPMAFLLVPPVMKVLEARFHSGVFMLGFTFWAVAKQLRGDEFGMLDRAICRAGLDLLKMFQNPDGSWNDSVVLTTLCVTALPAAGLTNADPMLSKALDWLMAQGVRDATGMRFDGFGSAVWATAFDIRALLESGARASDPAVANALGWLTEVQCTRDQPRLNNRKPNVHRTGGWAFQGSNPTMPDSDDTGVVLSAMGLALRDGTLDRDLEARVRQSVGKAHAWLLDMQNPDGGWSAYVWGLPGKEPGPALEETPRVSLSNPLQMGMAFLRPPMPLGDPSTEDVTSRVLHGLGHTGFSLSDKRVQHAVDFLKRMQCDNGAWWGRWVLNYLSCTAFVLMGLKAVGADMSQGWIRSAIDWVLSKQNEDGGWGEGPKSYPDPSLAGIGPSMPPLTGLVLKGLLDAGVRSADIDRAAAYLMAQQRGDGTWPNHNYLHVNIPPDTFFIYPEATKFYAPAALGTWARETKLPAPPPSPWTDALLDEARQQMDPLGDKIVADIYQRGNVPAVRALIDSVMKNDDALPKGLPEETKEYFAQPLPAWADAKKIALAQELFTREGWGVAAALFCSSLPQAYAAANGAIVLTQTQAMLDRTQQRIFETAQFIFDIGDRGSMGGDGRGRLAALKVRLMHAGVRHLILLRPGWDAAKLGLPINQEDMAGTLMTFSVVVLDALERMEVAYSPAEAQAWFHLWQVVGHLLGVRPELVPQDLGGAELLMDRIRVRQWAASPGGQHLTKALVAMMQAYFELPQLETIPIALLRQLSGDRCGDLLGLPPSRASSLIVDLGEQLAAALDPDNKRLDLFGSVTHLAMKLVVNGKRDWKQANFRIPQSLLDTVQP